VIRTLADLAPAQLGFVVHDLETAAQRFEAALGAGPWDGYLIDETLPGERLYHGRPADWSVRLAGNNTDPQYELIQPIKGPSVHAERLEQHGEGFHHVLYVVESIDAVEAEMRHAGHMPVMEWHSFGVDGDGRVIYFDTVDAIGCFVESVEPPAQWPQSHFAF
jgi:methylmalonyl-CoA/ethylmalonyl-CoA epimerase